MVNLDDKVTEFLTEKINTDLNYIFDLCETGCRYDDCRKEHIDQYFRYLYQVALKYRDYNFREIDNFICRIINHNETERAFFIYIEFMKMN